MVLVCRHQTASLGVEVHFHDVAAACRDNGLEPHIADKHFSVGFVVVPLLLVEAGNIAVFPIEVSVVVLDVSEVGVPASVVYTLAAVVLVVGTPACFWPPFMRMPVADEKAEFAGIECDGLRAPDVEVLVIADKLSLDIVGTGPCGHHDMERLPPHNAGVAPVMPGVELIGTIHKALDGVVCIGNGICLVAVLTCEGVECEMIIDSGLIKHELVDCIGIVAQFGGILGIRREADGG